jgi:hypothetical protein
MSGKKASWAGTPLQESRPPNPAVVRLARRAELRAARAKELEEHREFTEELARSKSGVRDIRRYLRQLGIDTREPFRTPKRSARRSPEKSGTLVPLYCWKGSGGFQSAEDEDA